MALIEWRDDFKVGVASVDHEHAEMIALLNQLDAKLAQDAGPDAILDFLGEVHAKIGAHFALEEKEMRDRRYDDYAVHKDDHERLLDDIRDIMDRVEAAEAFDYRETLAAELSEWFGAHFKTKDARLHKMLG